MTLVSTVTVGAGGAASIEFTSIAGSFTDLMAVCSLRSNRSAVVDDIRFRINSDSTSGRYSFRFLYGSGSATGSGASGTETSGYMGSGVGNTVTASTNGNAQLYIPNYAGSTQKSYSSDSVTENNATNAEQIITAGLYNQTTAITSLSFFPANGTLWNQYSTISLYGILKGSGGATVS